MIGNAASKFDNKGNLTDETIENFIKSLLHNLVEWARLIGQR